LDPTFREFWDTLLEYWDALWARHAARGACVRWSLRARGRISEAARGNASTNELQGYVVDQVTALKHTLRKMSGVDAMTNRERGEGQRRGFRVPVVGKMDGFSCGHVASRNAI
jgi:hypothetical protein